MNSHPEIQYCKTPLSLDRYEQFNISQYYQAFIIEFQKISLDRCDDIEQQLQLDGYKIFHADTVFDSGHYNILFIVAQSNQTF